MSLKNREVWTKANAEYTDRKARESWAKEEIDWGMFSGLESELERARRCTRART